MSTWQSIYDELCNRFQSPVRENKHALYWKMKPADCHMMLETEARSKTMTKVLLPWSTERKIPASSTGIEIEYQIPDDAARSTGRREWPEIGPGAHRLFMRVRNTESIEEALKIVDSCGSLYKGSSAFSTEAELRDYLVDHWGQTTLAHDWEFVDSEYWADTGPMDILAKSLDGKTWLVIELKLNRASDDVIGQVTRYMGWLEDNREGDIWGLIIANGQSKGLVHSLKYVQNVEFMEYRTGPFELVSGTEKISRKNKPDTHTKIVRKVSHLTM